MIYTDDWAFVHIPKTGGVNFKRRIPKELIKGEFHYPKDTKVPLYYWWHQPISYQIEHNSNLSNIHWITIVRHPADRLMSYYLFVKRRLVEFDLPDWNITLEDYIKNSFKHTSLTIRNKINTNQEEWSSTYDLLDDNL